MKYLVTLLFFISVNCFAANDYVGRVSTITAEAGIVRITLKDGSGDTGCGQGNHFWFKMDGDFSQAMLSIAMIAKATQDMVYVLGHSACETEWPYKTSRKMAVIKLRES